MTSQETTYRFNAEDHGRQRARNRSYIFHNLHNLRKTFSSFFKGNFHPHDLFSQIRLLLHGRLHMDIKKWLMFFSATRNPYNTTERLELDWMNVDLLWTNGK